MRKKYLVTGGLGFIGAPFVRELVRSGNDVRILDNSSRGSSERLADVASSVEVLIGDIRNPGVVDRAVDGVESVCHLAYVNGTRYFYERPAYVLDVGVKGIVNVLDACIRRNVPELILASSSEVYQTPPRVPTPETVPALIPDIRLPRYSYGGGKIISELMAINYGRAYFERVVIFRPHNVFGPDMGWEHVIPEFVSRLCRQSPNPTSAAVDFPIQGDGSQSRAFIFIEDFIRGLMIVLERGDHLEVYNIGTENEIRMAELAARVAALLNVEIRLVPGPRAEGGTQRRCPDTSKLRQLGFSPTWSFDDSLRQTVRWYRDNARESTPPSSQEFSIFLPEMR
jgi:nucleoside-diphosphate-sugar epimerase